MAPQFFWRCAIASPTVRLEMLTPTAQQDRREMNHLVARSDEMFSGNADYLSVPLRLSHDDSFHAYLSLCL